MSAREETRIIRLAYWKQIFADRAGNGLTVKDYCIEKGVIKEVYYCWKSLARTEVLATVKAN